MLPEFLQQTGVVNILLYLRGKTQVKITELTRVIKAAQDPVYKSVNLLLERTLIYEEILIGPLRRVFSLTEKGQQVAQKLAEIEEILGEPRNEA